MKTNSFEQYQQHQVVYRPWKRKGNKYFVQRVIANHSEQQLRLRLRLSISEGNYSSAIALLNTLIRLHPSNANDFNNRGLIHFYNGQWDQALADYNQALTLNPRLDSAYNNRANCYASQGNLAAALTDYEQALNFNPGNLMAWLNQGITFRDLGLYDLALENFDLALNLGKYLKGRIYAERGYTYYLRGDWNCAIADYQRALTILKKTSKSQDYIHKVESWLNQSYS